MSPKPKRPRAEKPTLWLTANKILLQSKTVSFFEFINTSAGIDKFLLASKERMAFTANIYFNYVGIFSRTCLESFTTSTLNGDNFIIWM